MFGRTYRQQQGEGKWAFRDGLHPSDNPYYDEPGEEAAEAADAWDLGYRRAEREAEILSDFAQERAN